MYDKLIRSEAVEKAALGVPNRVLASVSEEGPTAEDASSFYLIRVRSQDDPTVSVFSFGGADEKEVAGRIRRGALRHH